MMIMKKWINILTWVVGVGVLITLFSLSVAVSSKNKKLKTFKKDLHQKELIIDSLQKRCKALGEMDCIRVSTVFEVKNINTLGIQHTGNIEQLSSTYASYTRQWILDSVYNKK